MNKDLCHTQKMYYSSSTHSCGHVTVLHTGCSKYEVVPIHTMQAYKGNGGTAPLNLDLGTR
jgi:hypothetical protein